jgi:hypothetical protein
MTSRRVWTVVAVLSVFAEVVAATFLGAGNSKVPTIIMVIAGFLFPFAVMGMRVRGQVSLAGFAVAFCLLMGSGATASAAWLSLFGEASECTIHAKHMERTSKTGTQWHYALQCGDRRYDSVVLSSRETSVGDPGDRTTVIFDRHELVAPARPENMTSVGLWLVPLLVLAALGLVGYASTLPIEPRQPRRSAKQQSEAKPVDQ